MALTPPVRERRVIGYCACERGSKAPLVEGLETTMAIGRALRDQQFRGTRTVYVVGPLEARIIDALPQAFTSVVHDDPLGIASVAWPSGRRLRSDAERARQGESSIHRSEAPSDVDLLRTVIRRGSGPLAATLEIAGDTIALSVEHGVADGGGALRLLELLLALAAGRRVLPVPRAAHLPVLAASLAAGPAALRKYVDARGSQVVRDPSMMPMGPRGADAEGRFVRLRFDEQHLDELRRAGGRSASVTTALVALAATVLRRTHLGSSDPRVVLPVDLRRLLPGRSVTGNLIATEAAGALLADEWDTAAVSARLRRQIELAAPQLLIASTRPLRRLGRAVTLDREVEHTVSISVQRLASPELQPSHVLIGVAAVAPATPSATLASAMIVGSGATLSIWDDSGSFDLSMVPQVMDELIAGGGWRR